MRFPARSLILIALLAGCAAAVPRGRVQTSAPPRGPRVYEGQLRLVESGKASLPLAPASATEIASLPTPLAPGQRAFMGVIPLRAAPAKMLLVESATGAMLYLKAGLEGPFAASDRHHFEKPRAESPQRYEAGDEVVAIDRPLPAGGFIGTYALRLVRNPAREDATRRESGWKPEQRLLFASEYMAEGVLDTPGKPTVVRYALDYAGDGTISDRYIAVDSNGDGKFDRLSNREIALRGPGQKAPVFRIGTVYVAPRSYDKTKGTFAFEERPSGDYEIFELEVGAPVPDFSFLDLEGKRQRLSERKGRYVLLHFWMSSCPPCEAEADRLKELDAKYRARGLDIIGLNPEDELGEAKAFLGKHPASWTEAVAGMPGNDDVARLVLSRFGIRSFPNAILVDPDGTVLAMAEAGTIARERAIAILEARLGR